MTQREVFEAYLADGAPASLEVACDIAITCGWVHELLVRWVCRTYERDKSAPSVITSYVRKVIREPVGAERQSNGPAWYASIVRYRGRFGEDKLIVMNFYAETLDAALIGLLNLWRQRRGTARRPRLFVARNGGRS